jgi:hypothetical protein
MFYRWRRQLRIWNFNRQIREVMETPPVRVIDAPWTLVSMINTHDVPMYILGIKSFYARVGKGKITAIIDRDMPETLRSILRRHFVGIELVVLETIDTGACQRGGTWERLVFLLELSERQYAIQVDADTLSFGPNLQEVVQCIEQNVPFTMADRGTLMSMRDAAAKARASDSNYVGIVAERLFDRYPDCDTLRYVRGSSGLAGFSKGGFTRGQIEVFHRTMEALVGSRWREWGTEQCGSNFAIANSPGAVVLPHPDYASYGPGARPTDTKFFHFIGSHRFHGGCFAALGHKVIKELKAA